MATTFFRGPLQWPFAKCSSNYTSIVPALDTARRNGQRFERINPLTLAVVLPHYATVRYSVSAAWIICLKRFKSPNNGLNLVNLCKPGKRGRHHMYFTPLGSKPEGKMSFTCQASGAHRVTRRPKDAVDQITCREGCRLPPLLLLGSNLGHSRTPSDTVHLKFEADVT